MILIAIFLFLLVGINSLWNPSSNLLGKVLSRVDTSEKVVFLTFDDGPGFHTNDILDILNETNTKATFFILGERAIADEVTLNRTISEGHLIGIHSMTHPFGKTGTELSESKSLLENLTGEHIVFFVLLMVLELLL